MSRQLQTATGLAEGSTKSEMPLNVTEDRVREIVEHSLLPLRTAVEEIKTTVARELEEERILLRDHLAAVQNNIMNQLIAIRTGINQQLETRGLSQQQIHGNETTKEEAQLELLPQEVQHHEMEQEATVEAASTTSEGLNHQQNSDINVDLKWFKDQVTILQEEHKQYRQELRRQEQQQMLQQNVSVSKSELQDELKVTKTEILSSVKALCAYMEVEISGSSKTLHEETKDALREMLSDNKKCVHNEVTDTMARMLSENQSLGQNGREAARRDGDPVPRQAEETDTSNLIQGVLEKLQALTMGQSQRVIDKIRNPQCENRYVFHLYIPSFADSIGTDKRVYSLPCAMDFTYSFMVVRGLATFPKGTTQMIIELEHIVDAHELGLDQGKAISVSAKTKVLAQKSSGKPDIELAEQTVRWGGDPTAATDKHVVTLGNPAQCIRFAQPAYNSFKDDSVIIEFEIMPVLDQQRSVFSLFKG